MRIKMLKAEKGSPDGLQVITYEEGAEYSVPSSLGGVFVSIGSAVDLDAIESCGKHGVFYGKGSICLQCAEEKEAAKAAEVATKEAAEKAAKATKRQNKRLDPQTETKEG